MDDKNDGFSVFIQVLEDCGELARSNGKAHAPERVGLDGVHGMRPCEVLDLDRSCRYRVSASADISESSRSLLRPRIRSNGSVSGFSGL